MNNVMQRVRENLRQGRGCVGLDPNFEEFPERFRGDNVANGIMIFNTSIVEATCDTAGFYKLNAAFYEQYGIDGLVALQATVRRIRRLAPKAVVIYDAKRADIDSTAAAYAVAAFRHVGADAITVLPNFGPLAMKPFLDQKDEMVIVVVRTSNKGGGRYQDRLVADGLGGHEPLYLHYARSVAQEWDDNGNCAVVAGATYPEELREVRKAVGDDMPILVPGVGAQGGSASTVIRQAGLNVIVNSSRGVMYPWLYDQSLLERKAHESAALSREAFLKLHGELETAAENYRHGR